MFFIIKLSRRPLLVVVLSAALLPRMASGERSEAPTAAGASSFLFLVLLFLWLSPIGGSGWKPSPDDGKIHRCAGGCAGGYAGGAGGCAVGGSPPRMGSGERSEAPTAEGDSSS